MDDGYDALVGLVRRALGRDETAGTSEVSFPGMTSNGVIGPGNGRHMYVEAPPEFEASVMQACGFWPFSVGASTALVGAPLGNHYFTGQPVAGDPISAFTRGIVSAPSAFVLGLNGRGKSSVVIRILAGIKDLTGTLPMSLGDLKPDYVGFTQETGGMVVRIARGVGGLNVLDAGPLAEYLDRLSPARQRKTRAEIHGRRLNALQGLVEMVLRSELSERSSEVTILSVAIEVAAEQAQAAGVQPLPVDVLRVISERHPRVRENIIPCTDEEFDDMTSNLRTGLNGLGPHGPFGDVFCQQTTVEIPMDQALCFDLSGIPSTDTLLRAAAQLACWSHGQAISSAAKILAQEGLAPEHHHVMVMDELWQILEAWEGSVYRINAITRLNRTEGLGQIMITHSMKDLELSTPERTKIARGFVERSSQLFLGGLARNEMPDLLSIRPFSKKEQDLLVMWSQEGSINPVTGVPNPPPGRGNFLLKTGDLPGIPFSTGRGLTRREREIHDTNEAWAAAMGAHGDR